MRAADEKLIINKLGPYSDFSKYHACKDFQVLIVVSGCDSPIFDLHSRHLQYINFITIVFLFDTLYYCSSYHSNSIFNGNHKVIEGH